MYIKQVTLKNWRNFRNADGELSQVSYILGANAAGKSNFLDVFRFLRDIAKSEGGVIPPFLIELMSRKTKALIVV